MQLHKCIAKRKHANPSNFVHHLGQHRQSTLRCLTNLLWVNAYFELHWPLSYNNIICFITKTFQLISISEWDVVRHYWWRASCGYCLLWRQHLSRISLCSSSWGLVSERVHTVLSSQCLWSVSLWLSSVTILSILVVVLLQPTLVTIKMN